MSEIIPPNHAVVPIFVLEALFKAKFELDNLRRQIPPDALLALRQIHQDHVPEPVPTPAPNTTYLPGLTVRVTDQPTGWQPRGKALKEQLSNDLSDQRPSKSAIPIPNAANFSGTPA